MVYSRTYLIGQRVEIAIEGSRHFRRPSGLFGEMPYEGCQIAVLAEATVSRRDSFLKHSSSVALRGDSLVGQKMAVFEEKVDDDIWTTFLAFPKPNLVLACTNRAYLREVLERIGGKVGKRALSETLAEWKFVDTEAPFWGLRHYDKSQAGLDPTSPFVDRNIFGTADRQASGVAFRFDPRKGNVVTISYFSSTRDILGFLQHTPLSMEIDGVVDSTANLPVSAIVWWHPASPRSNMNLEVYYQLMCASRLRWEPSVMGPFSNSLNSHHVVSRE